MKIMASAYPEIAHFIGGAWQRGVQGRPVAIVAGVPDHVHWVLQAG